jgi:hypothetical protein
MYESRNSGRERIAIVAVTAFFLLAAPSVARAQHDSTKHAMPGMKMPSPGTKKATPAATKTRTKTKTARAPAKKPAARKPPAAAQKRDTAAAHAGHMQTPDTAHAHKPDSARMQMPDTAHAHQPDTAKMQMPDSAAPHVHMRDTTMQAHDTMSMAHRDTMPMEISMTGPLGISMERMGSGTTWIPDAVILPSRHWMLGDWMVMLHGFAFAQYDEQGGPRGASQFGSLNWAMVMADRPIGGGRLQLRFMPSLDPATVGKCGYPMLLQSGEMCNGKPIVDRQHPHDLFMELGALYERPVASNLALLLYAAPAGEPALGPVAFMHRPSAMDEPQAPLGHHWQDATHISFGVVTAGIFTRTLRLEASAFNGHEPNDERWDFDPLALNSYSARLTLNPTEHWSLTAGYGLIDNPELSSPAEDVRRFVASAMHGRKLGMDGQWTTTLIFGRNTHEGGDGSSSALVETEAIIDRHNTLFGRAELVQKSAEELQVTPGFPAEQLFNVSALSLGYIRELRRGRGMTIGFGARGTVNLIPSSLEPTYGSRSPVGGMVFLRLRPYHSQPHSPMQMRAGTEHQHGQ